MYTHPPFHAGPLLFLIIAIVVLLFVFEVWMIIDAALNKQLSDKAKTLWIIGMILVHPIVAIVYFFTDRRKRV